MRNHEAAMLAYARLAVISHDKQQALARDRFVLLCGVEACRAGWLDVAQTCYELHTQYARGHQLGQFASLPEALRNGEFLRIVEQTERWCHHERAEALSQGLVDQPAQPTPDTSAGSEALRLLQALHTSAS